MSNEGEQFENLSRMNKGEEQGLSTLSSSYCSSSHFYSGSTTEFNRVDDDDDDDENLDDFRPMPEGSNFIYSSRASEMSGPTLGNRIPLSAFEPSYPNNEWSMISDATPYEPTPDMFSQNFDYSYASGTSTSMKSPSTQPMDRSSTGYDPERIPSSIFSSKPSGPCDWSLASNESLFSIHNFSLARDEAIFLERSEELGLTGEFNSIPSANPFVAFESKASEANIQSSSNLESINESEIEHENKNSLGMEVDNDNEIEEEPSKPVEETSPKRSDNRRDNNQSIDEDVSTSVRSGKISGVEGTGSSITRISGVSGESGNSNISFAFPVFENEGKKSLSPVVPQSMNAEATTKKPGTRWFSFDCFSIFRTWPRCCPCAPCCCL